MNGCMDAWMHGCMDAWMLGCVYAWMLGWMRAMHACLHGCMLVWTHRCLDGFYAQPQKINARRRKETFAILVMFSMVGRAEHDHVAAFHAREVNARMHGCMDA